MIIDCFPFHQELELLEIRLNILAPIVDLFVIAEAPTTFSGKPKDLILGRNIDRFRDFPIQYQVIGLEAQESSWAREMETRDKIGRIVSDIVDDYDIVIFGDLDEIPNPITVVMCVPIQPIRLIQRYFSFYLNAEKLYTNWSGSVIAPGYAVKDCSWANMRNGTLAAIADGGWHFGSCFGEAEIINKLESFSHTEMDNEATKESVLASRRDMRDIGGNGLVVADIDDTFPAYIRENQDKYRHLIWPC